VQVERRAAGCTSYQLKDGKSASTHRSFFYPRYGVDFMKGWECTRIFGITLVGFMLLGIIRSNSQEEQKPLSSIKVSRTCGNGGITTDTVYAASTTVDLLSEPRQGAPKVVNVITSKYMGNTVYESVFNGTEVRELCRQGDWSEIELLGEPVAHRGWLPSRFLHPIQSNSAGKRIYTEDDFDWEKNYLSPWKTRKNTLVAGVNKSFNENKRCAKVILLQAAQDQGTASNPRFFVMCADEKGVPFNVFFSLSDI
jgi:hypothetical protein